MVQKVTNHRSQMLEYRFDFSQIPLKRVLLEICDRCVFPKVYLYRCDLSSFRDMCFVRWREGGRSVIKVKYRQITNNCCIFESIRPWAQMYRSQITENRGLGRSLSGKKPLKRFSTKSPPGTKSSFSLVLKAHWPFGRGGVN